MDETPLDDYISLLQSKTGIIDYCSRELQSYSALFKSLRLELTTDQFHDVEAKILIATNSCDNLETQMQDVVKELQTILSAAEGPKL